MFLTLSVPVMPHDITNFNAILRHTKSLIRDRKGLKVNIETFTEDGFSLCYFKYFSNTSSCYINTKDICRSASATQ